jgi:hypothetical protein
MLYLKEVWGLDQKTIAALERCSQQQVSKQILIAKKGIPHDTVVAALDFTWSIDEIRYIQFLPREIIKDIEVVAFVNDILGVTVQHPFFEHYDYNASIRIAALGRMGIQNKHLVSLFKKPQPTISMTIKRVTEERLSVERPQRYDSTAPYYLAPQKYKSSFILAGGQSV